MEYNKKIESALSINRILRINLDPTLVECYSTPSCTDLCKLHVSRIIMSGDDILVVCYERHSFCEKKIPIENVVAVYTGGGGKLTKLFDVKR